MLLEVRGVVREFARRRGDPHRVLDGVDLAVDHGRIVTIRGRSGSGKTTLLRILAGLLAPTAGSVTVDGLALHAATDAERAAARRRRIGYVTQADNLVPELDVVENVALGLLLDGVPARDALPRAHARLAAVELDDHAHADPADLSAGERTRVAIARALVADPRLVLADEPTGTLDATTAATALDVLVRTTDRDGDRGAALVLVTHDADAAALGQERYELRDGRLHAGG